MHEQDWIKRYIFPLVTSPGADGLRDDVAVLSTAPGSIVTMDTIVMGEHFLPTDPLDTVGQKLVRVNVSDIRSKGAVPGEALLSIAWPKQLTEADFQRLVSGIGHDLTAFGVSLIGGDLVGTNGPLLLTMTLIGQCLGDAPVRRSGGCVGQALYVDGEIGWGFIGLKAALNGGSPDALARYRVPEISTQVAAQIVAANASASMDVSDGLLLDASRLADASGCGVRIDLDSVPLAGTCEKLDDVLHLCTGGDDYRILMAAAPDIDLPGFTAIGVLTKKLGLQLEYRGERVNAPSTLGFEH